MCHDDAPYAIYAAAVLRCRAYALCLLFMLMSMLMPDAADTPLR